MNKLRGEQRVVWRPGEQEVCGEQGRVEQIVGGRELQYPGSQKLARKFRNTVLEIRVTFKMI